MSRTDEVRNSGARPIGGGDNAPFIKWGNSYVWVEGVIESFWEGDFGKVARLRVTNAHPELEGQKSKDEPREGIGPGMTANLGLSYAALNGIEEHLRGATVHVAFTGWGETKGGQRFREFTVLELEPAPARQAPASSGGGGSSSSPAPVTDDNIPF